MKMSVHFEIIFLLITSFIGYSFNEIFNSATKLREFASLETSFLKGLQQFIIYEEERLIDLRRSTAYEDEIEMCMDRLKDLNKLQEVAKLNTSARATTPLDSKYPSTVYLMVKDFLINWAQYFDNKTIAGTRMLEFSKVEQQFLPLESDLFAIKARLLRTQLVYNLTSREIMSGLLFGHQGPPLTAADAYDLGDYSLNVAKLPKLAREWLELAAGSVPEEQTKSPPFRLDLAYLTLAEIYRKSEEYDESVKAIQKAQRINATSDYVHQQAIRIRSGNSPFLSDALENVPDWWNNYTQLCRGNVSKTPIKRTQVCRYRNGTAPYRRYKEEILSLSPYISRFYDVITDEEMEELREDTVPLLDKNSLDKLRDHLRQSEVSYASHIVPVANKISDRIADMTGLDVTPRIPYFSSAEPLQVEVYAVGGYYDNHLDMFTKMDDNIMKKSGDRLASFSIYMNDVDAGGDDVFTSIGISVKPQKGTALFWYNYNPMGEPDLKTAHASCPVVVGEKWLANKWIWTHGNEARQICGRRKLSSHYYVDRAIFSNRYSVTKPLTYEREEEDDE